MTGKGYQSVDEEAQVIDAESFFRVAHVSRETMARLSVYESSLIKWQKSLNLVSKSTLNIVWQRHFWDSAQLFTLAPETAVKWLDLGSGGGFPGLVLAILASERPNFKMHLVESDQKKAIFLREVIRQTGAPAQVYNSRMEAAATIDEIGVCDVVTARACAPLERLFGWAVPYFGTDTMGLFLKGVQAQEELTIARKSWTFDLSKFPSRAEAGATIFKVEHLGRARK